ncbi:MAG: hypothetical protein IKK98_06250 [Oscillospiraceae bacterium]|nr:hypothetical protein [Oscillospiraceae bacterium]
MCENRFYVCEHCGNIVGMIHDAGVPMMCCGQKMKQLEPGTVEASVEKHIPVVTVDGAPEVIFALADEKPVAAYAYCNLHGLWKTDVK